MTTKAVSKFTHLDGRPGAIADYVTAAQLASYTHLPNQSGFSAADIGKVLCVTDTVPPQYRVITAISPLVTKPLLGGGVDSGKVWRQKSDGSEPVGTYLAVSIDDPRFAGGAKADATFNSYPGDNTGTGTDNTAALQAAIDYVHTNFGRGTVKIPTANGDYLFKGTIVQREGVRIVCDGFAHALSNSRARFVHQPTTPGAHFFTLAFTISADDYHVAGVELHGLELIGTPGVSGNAIHWVGPEQWTIAGCFVKWGFQDGLHLEGSLWGKVDRHSTFAQCVTPLRICGTSPISTTTFFHTTNFRTPVRGAANSGGFSVVIERDSCQNGVTFIDCTCEGTPADTVGEAGGFDIHTGNIARFVGGNHFEGIPGVSRSGCPLIRAGVGGEHRVVPTDTTNGHTVSVTATVQGVAHTATHTNGPAETVATIATALAASFGTIAGVTITASSTDVLLSPAQGITIACRESDCTGCDVVGKPVTIDVQGGDYGGSNADGGSPAPSSVGIECGHVAQCHVAPGSVFKRVTYPVTTQRYVLPSGSLPGGGTARLWWRGLFSSAGVNPWGSIADWSRARGDYPGSMLTAQGGAIENVSRARISSGTNKYWDIQAAVGGTDSDLQLVIGDYSTGARTIVGQLDAFGNLVMGTGALATNATDGFFAISGGNGPPTGVPAHTYAGRTLLYFDYSQPDLYAYVAGGWRVCPFMTSRVNAATLAAPSTWTASGLASFDGVTLIESANNEIHKIRGAVVGGVAAPYKFRARVENVDAGFCWLANNTGEIVYWNLTTGAVVSATGGFLNRCGSTAGSGSSWWIWVEPMAPADLAILDFGTSQTGVTRSYLGTGKSIKIYSADLYQVRGA